MPTRRFVAIGLTTLAAALLTACNTEWGPGDNTGGGDGNNGGSKYPTLDGTRPQSFAQGSIDGRPANTLANFDRAVAANADYIAVDLVMSKDGALVALASPDITQSTNVASRPEFFARKTTKLIDGVSSVGWFASDFTLAELQTLRATLPTSSTVTGNFSILSLAQVLDYQRQNQGVALYLWTHNPTYHNKLKLNMEDPLVTALNMAGLNLASSPVIVRSLEVGHLQALRNKTKVRLVQMIDGNALAADGSNASSAPHIQPYDFTDAGVKTTYADMVTTSGLAQIQTYANGIAPWKPFVIPAQYLDKNGDGQPDDLNNDGLLDYRDRQMMTPTSLVTNAHAAKLFVHPWLFSNDPSTLASDFKGSPAAEYQLFYQVGVDGVFSDSPADANRAR